MDIKGRNGILRIIIPLIILFLISQTAFGEEVDIDTIRGIGIVVHLVELFMAVFICFMALRFFSITKPLNIFLYIYLAVGFFIISSLIYLAYYLGRFISFNLNFEGVYLASRFSLIAMLLVFSAIFYHANRVMRMSLHK